MFVRLFTVLILLSSSVSAAAAACNPLDRDSLVSFSHNVSPASSPLNWSSSADCCDWEGISCKAIDDKGDLRVTHLLLPSRALAGTISPSITNLSYLTHLNLSRNSLMGSVPSGLFSSPIQLRILDLSYNRLSGEFASSSSSFSSGAFQVLDLSSNRFYGAIPSAFFNLAVAADTLTSFNVSNNSFTGSIPTSTFGVSNSSRNSVRFLDFSSNEFSGQIVRGLGLCSVLKIFRAGYNDLSGPLPPDIYDAAALEEISIPANNLSGTIGDGILRLTNLKILELYSNQLQGPIPRDIGKLSNMEHLLLHINKLTGSLPPSLSDCINLITLNLRVNQLVGNIAAFDFSPLVSLNTLDLGNNQFTGNFPPSLYSCKSLKAVRMASNNLTGQILPDIVALQSLVFLSVSNNTLTNFTGAIRNLMACKNLSTLLVSKNFYGELMPGDDDTLDPEGFQNIQILALGGCGFPGEVPNWLAKLKKLQVLDLSVNRFGGSVPAWLGSLPMLFYIDLSANLLTGEFPVELCQLPALLSQEAYENFQMGQTHLELPVFVMPNNASKQQYNQLSSIPPAIYLNNNSLSGNIPSQIGQLKVLHVLHLNDNNFSGNIPDQVSNLKNLERLDLSSNHLSGQIPASLKGLNFLSWFSVANNNLQGPIPVGSQFDTFPASSFAGNPRLCGTILQRFCPSSQRVETHKGSNKRLIIGVLVAFLGTGFIFTVLAMWILSKRRVIPRADTDKIDSESISSNSNPLVPLGVDKDTSMVVLFPNNANGIKDLTISEILKATENFSQANIIGCGGFGLVYKATLTNGSRLAIKKLSGDLGLMEREFKAEVEALSTAQHKNLVALQGYSMHEGSRLLMYSYMENGSLDYWLHEKADGASQLDWPTRLKIAQGASCGVAYMHQICEPHIVHRDIKSSNILLDDKFEAHVADFGLSRLINPYQTHVTTELVGTLGYIPPEYGQSWAATLRGDMYSFGVVMLELLTGKRPMEVFKPKMSRELVVWVQQLRSEGKQDQIFDPLLIGKGFEEEMLQVLDMACMCVSQNPFKRPTIQEVVDWLRNVGAIPLDQNKE
ncbi:tyrosine-sulfated glycopeptide receptor 1 [Juglans microcarpa x Juglans regia]|uniref:tyrosine-sulfated glycopeptide receptor 1 n=1 Tax=Juglans microcarpa x Juglans regia TaxID=2249226 RepID=UPI001B7E0C2F|nr:tyrosine-sulfated glycopeptide receptor 1 [Juglans microcarpa x Juglans regia]